MAGERRLADVFFRVHAKVDAREVRGEVDRGIKGARLGDIGDREGQLFSKSMIDGLNKRLKGNDIKAFGSRWQAVITAALAIGPAVVPAAGVLVGAIAAIGAAAASAGAALGVFGFTTLAVFKDVQKQTKKLSDLNDKIKLLNEQIRIAPDNSKLQKALQASQLRAVNELQARLNLLQPGQRAAVSGYLRLRAAAQYFIDVNKPQSYQAIARAFNILSNALPHLEPLFKAGAAGADIFLRELSNFVTGGGLDKVVQFVTRRAVPAIKSFLAIFGNLGSGIAGIGKAFAPSSAGVLKFLEDITQKFQDFGQNLEGSSGFAGFISFLEQNGPDVVKSLKDIAIAAINIARATAPLAPITFAFIKAVAGITDALPPAVLTAIIAFFISLNLGLRIAGEAAPILTGAMKGANKAIELGGRFALGTRIQLALLAVQQKIAAAATVLYNAALNGIRFVQELWNASLLKTRIQLVLLRIQVLLSAAAEAIASAATAIWAGAMIALGVAIDIATGPIGIIILIIAAMVIGLIAAYKNSETFRNIVDGVFRFVAASASSFWNDFLKPIFGFLGRSFTNIGKTFTTIGLGIGHDWTSIKHVFQVGTLAILNFFLDAVGGILQAAVKLFGWVPGVGGKLKGALEEFNKFRDRVNGALGGIRDKKVTVTATGTFSAGPIRGSGVIAQLNGSILKFFADGAENHVAQVAKPGAMRLWAEPETGGEAYIPLSPTKRGRSTSILSNVASSFGYGLTKFANGAVVTNPQFGSLTKFTAAANKFQKDIERATANLVPKVSSSPGGGGSVARWLPVVLAVLAALHQGSSNAGAVLRRIAFESGGNPNAINLSDSNARAGHPSQGLVQTIPGTFFAYAGPYASRGITDPFANIYAGMNYALHRYGSIGAIDPLVRPRGYARGGVIEETIAGLGLRTGKPYLFGENGRETVTPGVLDANTLAAAIVAGLENSKLARDIGSEVKRGMVKGTRA